MASLLFAADRVRLCCSVSVAAWPWEGGDSRLFQPAADQFSREPGAAEQGHEPPPEQRAPDPPSEQEQEPPPEEEQEPQPELKAGASGAGAVTGAGAITGAGAGKPLAVQQQPPWLRPVQRQPLLQQPPQQPPAPPLPLAGRNRPRTAASTALHSSGGPEYRLLVQLPAMCVGWSVGGPAAVCVAARHSTARVAATGSGNGWPRNVLCIRRPQQPTPEAMLCMLRCRPLRYPAKE